MNFAPKEAGRKGAKRKKREAVGKGRDQKWHSGKRKHLKTRRGGIEREKRTRWGGSKRSQRHPLKKKDKKAKR